MMMDDPFALLGLPRAFRIDSRALQSAYLRKSAALHPDRFVDPIQQAEAARDAARLNEAHATLAEDERRADALLRLLGGPAREVEKSLPEGFLVEMMDMRQDMEHVLAGGDPAERRRMEAWAQEQRREYIDRVAAAFEALNDPASKESLRDIRVQLNAWRYIERMIEQLDPSHHPVM